MNAPEYTPPLDPDVASAVDQLDEVGLDFWLERAAVREFDGGLPRWEAELLALQDVINWQRAEKLHRSLPPSLVVRRDEQGRE